MNPFSREKVSKAAEEVAKHLRLVDDVQALKTAQTELGAALVAMSERMRALEGDMRVLKAETKLEALKEAQDVVFAVQNGLNERLERVAIQVAVIERTAGIGAPTLAIGRGQPSALADRRDDAGRTDA